MNLISSLTNGEVLHNIIPTIRDRISHLQDMISIASWKDLLDDSPGLTSAKQLINELKGKEQNFITYLDAETNKITTICVDVVDDGINYYATHALGGDEYVPVLDAVCGRIYEDAGEILTEGKFTFKTADGLGELNISQICQNVVDQHSIYDIIDTTCSTILTSGKVVAADIMAAIRNRITGVRGVAKDFLDTLTGALTASNVSSVVSVIKNYLNIPSLHLAGNGTWSFSQDYISKDWMSSTILSGLATVVSTVGMILAGMGNVAGLVLAGVGALASGIINIISQTATTDTAPVIEESEGREVAMPLARNTFQPSGADWTYMMELIQNKGPQHVEFGPIAGYMWNEDPNNLDVLSTEQDMYVELYPSSRSYVPTSDMVSFINDHFTRSVAFTAVTLPGGTEYQYDLTGTLTTAYSFEDVLTFYRTHSVVPEWDRADASDKLNIVANMYYSALCFLMLMYYASANVGTTVIDKSIYHDYAMPLTSEVTWLEWIARFTLFDYRIQHSDYPNYTSTYGIPGVEANWTSLTGNGIDMCTAIPNLFVAKMISAMNEYYDRYLQPSGYNPYFPFPVTYIAEIRYPLNVLPPKYDRSSFISGLILTTAITVIVTTATIIAAVKIHQWRSRQQLKTQLKTEAAWQAAVDNPTSENINAYRKAALKQNTIGRLFGCSSISNTNYWGGGDDSLTPDGKIDQVLMRIG